MSRRLLTAGLTLAVLLAVPGWAGRAAAKPPDLPLADRNELAPAGDSRSESPPMESLFPMRPSARRTMASCLIFGVHPLLTLAPMGEPIVFDDDDAPELAAVFAAPPAPEAPHGSITISVGVNSDAGLTGSIEIKSAPGDAAESLCPWMRQHCAPPKEAPAADFDRLPDVLHNLEMLRQAQALLEDAQEFGRAGRVGDALECLDLVYTLCPGSRFDGAVRQTAAELLAPFFCGSPDGAAGAEEIPVLHKKEKEQEREIDQKLKQPVTVHFHEAPLREVIDDIRACYGVNICVDKAALDEKEISLDHPVTINLEVVSLKTALKLVLEQVQLTYIVKSDVVQITTEPAGRRPGRITYQVGDVSVPVPEDAVPLTPCLPPVDPNTPAALDQLLRREEGKEPSKDAATPTPEWPHGSFEFGFGLDGSVQMFTQFRRGGAVWHLYYGNGGLSVWAAPVAADDASGD